MVLIQVYDGFCLKIRLNMTLKDYYDWDSETIRGLLLDSVFVYMKVIVFESSMNHLLRIQSFNR